MPERKTMVTISRITDDDTGMYQMGEIDGAFQEQALADYLDVYGERGLSDLTAQLAYLQFQVIRAWRERNEKRDVGCNCEGAGG